MPGGLRGLQNRCRLAKRAEVSSILTLSASNLSGDRLPNALLRRAQNVDMTGGDSVVVGSQPHPPSEIGIISCGTKSRSRPDSSNRCCNFFLS